MSPNDEAVYRALLRTGPTELSTLAAATEMSVGALRRAIPRLEELGLVSRLTGRRLRLVATVHAARYLPLELGVADIAFGPRGQVYAATRSYYAEGLLKGGRGVLVSTDGGRSYASTYPGLGTLDVLSLAVGPGDRVYAGLGGGGVYVLD